MSHKWGCCDLPFKQTLWRCLDTFVASLSWVLLMLWEHERGCVRDCVNMVPCTYSACSEMHRERTVISEIFRVSNFSSLTSTFCPRKPSYLLNKEKGKSRLNYYFEVSCNEKQFILETIRRVHIYIWKSWLHLNTLGVLAQWKGHIYLLQKSATGSTTQNNPHNVTFLPFPSHAHQSGKVAKATRHKCCFTD